MFQVGGGGPMVGRLGFSLKFAGRDYEDKRPRERYAAESRLLLDALNQRLERRRWPTGENYTVHCRRHRRLFLRSNLLGFFEAGDLLGIGDFAHVARAR